MCVNIESIGNDGIKVIYPELAPSISRVNNDPVPKRQLLRERWQRSTEVALSEYWKPDFALASSAKSGVFGDRTRWKEPIIICFVNFFASSSPAQDLDNRIYKWMTDALVNTLYIKTDTAQFVRTILTHAVPNAEREHTEMWVVPAKDSEDIFMKIAKGAI